jgi:DNA-binding NtrC family response regulator
MRKISNSGKGDDAMVTPSKEMIMVVDDEETIRNWLRKFFTYEGFEVESFGTYDSALTYAQHHHIDLCITDLNLNDPDQSKDGIALLKQLKQTDLKMEIIILTGSASPQTSSEAMKHGAFYYASKPIALDEIRLLTRRALEYKRIRKPSWIMPQRLPPSRPNSDNYAD